MKNREVFIWAGVLVVALAVLIIFRPHPLWVAAGGIVIGAALIVRASALPTLPAKEVGTAVLIAGFLALTLDRYLRRSAIEDVMRGVAPYYMTFGLPQQLADEVVYLRGVQLVRKNLEIKLWLKQEGTNPDSLTFETEMSYTLVNYSNDPKSFRFHAGATGGARRALLLQAAASGLDLVGSTYDTTFTPSTQPAEAFDRWVKIPPNKNDPHNRFVLRTRGPKHADDSETIFLVDEPSLNVEVEIVEKPKDIRADVVFGHRNQGDFVEVLPTRDNPGRWTLNAPLLPWSAVYVEWYQKPRSGR